VDALIVVDMQVGLLGGPPKGAMYTAITYTLAATIIVVATRSRLGLGKESGNAADFQTKL